MTSLGLAVRAFLMSIVRVVEWELQMLMSTIVSYNARWADAVAGEELHLRDIAGVRTSADC